MKKTALTFLSISLLLAGSSILGNAINGNNYLKHFSPVTNQAQEVKSEEVAPKEEATEKALADMTLAELKSVAKERGIKGYSTMKKDDLISVLK